jgi:hypothetical protein
MNNIPVQGSGISYLGNAPAGDTSTSAPFAVSGVGFNAPRDGFSVGFWYAQRNAPASLNDSALIVSYGKVPGSFSDTSQVGSCWAIYVDDNSNIKIALSLDGSLDIDPDTTADLDNIRCGIDRSSTEPLPDFIDNVQRGRIEIPHIDSWNHFVWTYDPVGSGIVKCYLDAALVDQKNMFGFKPNQPDFHGQIMSVFGGLVGDWDWTDDDIFDEHGVLTDLFYIARPLTESEVRYIAFSGIADAPPPQVASGIIGGYIPGQDVGSGHIGGYMRGLTDASGHIGGLITGSIVASGYIGGYASGINPPASGLLGGYITGSTVASGYIGGLVLGTVEASGYIGGFMLGGLSGKLEFDATWTVSALAASDFDAISQISLTDSADFDAKVIVFEDECLPVVDIPIPQPLAVSGLVPPFNQYFIGKASGQQGKTIVKTRWNIGATPYHQA